MAASTREKQLLFRDQRGRCNYCGKNMGLACFHCDHKIPLKRSGSSRVNNYQLICGPCNTRKGRLTDGEFRRKYKLPLANQAKGPPSQVVPQSYFEEKSKKIAARKAKKASSGGLLL